MRRRLCELRRGELRRRYADQVDRGDSAGHAAQRIRSTADQRAAVPVRLHIGKRIRTGDPKVGSQIDYVMRSEPVNRQAAPQIGKRRVVALLVNDRIAGDMVVT